LSVRQDEGRHTCPPRLTDYDRGIIAEARELASLSGKAVCEYTGQADLGTAYASALGRAQFRLEALVRLVEHLAADTIQEAAK
jgi:hypothetical protein